MIVRLEVSASEKVSARSQFEPNHYSVLIASDQVSLQHPEEILEHADVLFRKAKEAIHRAQRADGLVVESPTIEAQPANGPTNGFGATEKQLVLIRRLSRERDIDEHALDRLALDRAGCRVVALDRAGASRLIGLLQSEHRRAV